MSVSQADFTAAMLDAALPVPDGLLDGGGHAAGRRFNVYRNNVAVSLTEALKVAFPVITKLLGETNMDGLARLYLQAHPPSSPLMMFYGEDFPDFLGHMEQLSHLGYLADAARLELAERRAYHAADAAPLDPARLAAVAPERLAELRLVFHPSTALVRSAFPVVTIWAMNAGELPAAAIAGWTPQDALVVRPHLVVEVLRLPPGGAVFLEALTDGMTLTTAAEAAMAADAAFDLAANLAGALGAGAFSAILIDQGDQP